ncbi:MAG: ExbD/TolR family protein [Nevskiales bacterium]
MRFRRHAHLPEDAGIDLAPMLDFFLNLLIFFIIIAAFVRDAGIEVQQPTAQTAQKQQRNNILIAITPGGEIWLDRQEVDLRLLRGQIERLRALNPDAAVVIQSDKDARTGLLVQVMDQARLAGVLRVAIAARESEPRSK